jgi:hypothetical protein
MCVWLLEEIADLEATYSEESLALIFATAYVIPPTMHLPHFEALAFLFDRSELFTKDLKV